MPKKLTITRKCKKPTKRITVTRLKPVKINKWPRKKDTKPTKTLARRKAITKRPWKKST